MTDLDDYRDTQQQDRDGFVVDDDQKAAWALRKLARARAEIDRIKDVAGAEIDLILQWQEETTGPLYRETARFEGMLVDYRRRLEQADPKLRKTYPVPGGALTRRQAPRTFDVFDPDALVAWLIENGHTDAIKAKPQTSKITAAAGFQIGDGTESMTIVDADGVMLPGVQVLRGPDRYGVTIDTPPTTDDDLIVTLKESTP
jgi:hypothetical protein